MSSKSLLKIEAFKKLLAKSLPTTPAVEEPTMEPLARMVRAFMEFDCDAARAESAYGKLINSMVDFNELRVTPAIELAALLGVRFPFAEYRCSALHRALQCLFDREHQMTFVHLKQLKQEEVRPYLLSLTGTNPYVEAVVALECFGIPAFPVDTKLALWLISKEIVPADTDALLIQQALEKGLKPTELLEYHRACRLELESFSPRVWPTPKPILAPVVVIPPPVAPPGAAPTPAPAPAAVSEKVEKVAEAPAAPVAKVKAKPPAPAAPAAKAREESPKKAPAENVLKKVPAKPVKPAAAPAKKAK